MCATRRTTMPLAPARALQRPLALLVLALFTLGPLLLLFSGCATPAASNGAAAAPVAQVQTVQQRALHLAAAPTISLTVRSAQRQLYRFASSNVGLMQPAVDAQGQVCVGEMHANRLGCLDTRTGVVTNWLPPGAQYGIMTTTIDARGDAWFAEQNANYIGRFDPRQQTFRVYPLGTLKGSPLGPQDLHFDGRGLLWFTAAEGEAIGRLDPQSGAIRLWPLPISPSALLLTPSGRVWFGAVGAIGFLEPASGQIVLSALPNPQAQVFSLAADRRGHLWFTEVLPGKLAMFDPATSTLTELSVPTLPGENPPALYTLVVDRRGDIWFVDVGANTLVRYGPARHALTFFQLSVPNSAPFGLTADPAGRLWFTAGGSSANYIGEMVP